MISELLNKGLYTGSPRPEIIIDLISGTDNDKNKTRTKSVASRTINRNQRFKAEACERMREWNTSNRSLTVKW